MGATAPRRPARDAAARAPSANRDFDGIRLLLVSSLAVLWSNSPWANIYSSGIALGGLLVAVAGVALVLLLQRLGIRSKLAYAPAAVLTWAGVQQSQEHDLMLFGLAVTLIAAFVGMEQASLWLLRRQSRGASEAA